MVKNWLRAQGGPGRGCAKTVGVVHRSLAAVYVASMSHVTAATLCNPLKQGGNSCDTPRHERCRLESQKCLILLAIPAEQ